MGKRVSILGSTGSIGESTLRLIADAKPGAYKIIALTAAQNTRKLAEQARTFDAECVAIANPEKEAELKALLGDTQIEILSGADGLLEAARRSADYIMAAIVGAAGLKPTLAAVTQGSQIGLANKECLVSAGDLFLDAVTASGATLLPVDSEHNAIFQALAANTSKSHVRRLILTASGGPFREMSRSQLANVKLSDALNHPVWDMGAKITIDSASLMNKGLELIEASYLFGFASEMIEIVIHPQSIIHSMVEYTDGSVLAQLGAPDMRTPIAHTLAWPRRMQTNIAALDFAKLARLEFFAPDPDKFPALRLARHALETGGQAPCVLNAVNEIAVAAFLDEKIKFSQICACIEDVLSQLAGEKGFARPPDTIDDVLILDSHARDMALRWLGQQG